MTHPYAWPEVRRGAERIVVETARCLSARGHRVTVLTSGSRLERHRDDRVTTLKLKRRLADNAAHEKWFGRRIAPLLALGRFDAVHSLMPYDALAAVRTRRLGGHRVVYEELGNPYRAHWNEIPDGEARRELVRTVDVYGCMSTYSLHVLEREWGRHGDLIPGGVRLSEFVPASSRAAEPTILFAGALDTPQKGLSDLLEAVGLLLEGRPTLEVWLSGSGDPSAIVAAAPTAVHDHVTLLPLGGANAQAERYGRAWVTSLPSRGDSFGLVLIESLAAGTPIVVADDGAPPQLVTDSTGAVAPPGDIKALAAALERGLQLAEDPATATACRTFATQFDWDTAIGPLLERLYGGAA
ncbi:MAG TPA: glycosyltransferase family 4 protein [Acidimicrobiales bacterium]